MNVTDLYWEPTASYKDFFRILVQFLYFVVRDPNHLRPGCYWTLVKENGIGLLGILALFGLTVCFTFVRRHLSTLLLQPLFKHFKLTPRTHSKLAESIWKFIFYFIASLWIVYVGCVKNQYFQKPSTTLANWNVHSAVSPDIQLLYLFEFAFYLHSIYSVMVLDEWRRDSSLLVFHHLLTLSLLGTSYLGRFTELATIPFLTHDLCDVWLEFAKISSYLRYQGGKRIRLYDNMAAVGFTVFCLIWYMMRVYYFPLRGIHVAGVQILYGSAAKIPFAVACYIMGWILFAMNIYWTVLISLMVLRLLKGLNFKELEDIREYDKTEKSNKVKHQ